MKMKRTNDLTIAFLGAGRMGAPMASRLISNGFNVRVWNRSVERLSGLVQLGGIVASTPAEAARGADVVITMLPDGPTVETVIDGDDGAFKTLARRRLAADEHDRHRMDRALGGKSRRGASAVRRRPGVRQRRAGHLR